MMGRESQEGQMSVLLVVTIAWFIFGSVIVIVNQVSTILLLNTEQNIFKKFINSKNWIKFHFCRVVGNYKMPPQNLNTLHDAAITKKHCVMLNKNANSSLHCLYSCFLYALFVQWSILSRSKAFYFWLQMICVFL